MSKIRAVILAGGEGTRLRPYTTVLPKPLLPLGEYPILEIILRQLKHCGLTSIAISTGYRADIIQSYFGKGKRLGLNIRYVRETKPLGTAGAVKLVNNLADDFLVINGDVLTDLDFKKVFKFHKQRKSAATVTTRERKVLTDFGVIESNEKGELVDYIEKPEHTSFVSMGVYVLHKSCRQHIRRDEHLGMPDLLLRLKDKGERVSCYKTKSVWCDLGRLDDFERAQNLFLENQKKFLFT